MSVEETVKKQTDNPMTEPKIEKVTVNIAVGKSGAPLEKAEKVLEQLTGQKPYLRKAKKTVRDFGIRKGEHIACVVSLREAKAKSFLEKVFPVIDNKLSRSCFDDQGNFAFGIKEHIEIPGTKYVPELGIFGMDVAVSLGKRGYRVKRRRRAKSKVGMRQILTRDEAMSFIKGEFGIEITE